MTALMPSRILIFMTLGASVFLCSTGARAELPLFYPPHMAVDIYYQTQSVSAENVDSTNTELRTGFELHQQGFWLDPRIVEFEYGFRPTISILDSSLQEGESTSELSNYDISVGILRGADAPVEAAITSSLSTNDYKPTLGGSIENKTMSHQARVLWKFAPFPMRFDVRQTDTYRKSNSLVSQSIIERKDLNRTFQISGNSSKLDLLIQHEAQDDRIDERNNDLQLDTAHLLHYLTWGRNSRLNTQLQYRRRIASQEFANIRWAQNFRIQHTEKLQSHASYNIESSTGVLKTTFRQTHYSLQHQLYSNLASTLNLFSSDSKSESMDLNELGVGVAFNYRKNLFGTGVSLNTSYSNKSYDRESRQGIVEIIDEAYEIPPDGRIVLSNPYIQQTSVIITDAAGSTIYLEGIDYEILGFDTGLLVVSVIPGGEIVFGQSILVSYLAELQPSGEFTQTDKSHSVFINRGRWSLSHSVHDTDSEIEQGFAIGALNIRQTANTNLAYSRAIRRGSLQLSSQRNFWRDSGSEVANLTFSGSAMLSINPAASINVSINYSNGRHLGQNGLAPNAEYTQLLDTEATNFSLGLTWRVTGSLNIKSEFSAWNRSYEFKQEPQRSYDEDVNSAHIHLTYRFRKFSADLQVFFNEWTYYRPLADNDSFTKDDGIRLHIRRTL